MSQVIPDGRSRLGHVESRGSPARSLASFRHAAAQHGYTASTLTDSGPVHTARCAGGRGGRTALEAELRRRGVVQKNSRPNHPTTCGRVERVQQTLLRDLVLDPTRD